MLRMIRITPHVRDAMAAHAIRELPNEACGMLSVADGNDLVDRFHPVHNAAVSPKLFQLDGQEMLDLERQAEAGRRALIGVMHSHTNTSAFPSPTDVGDASQFDPTGQYRHLIVSLRHAEPVMRCFTIVGDEITELLIVIADPDQRRAGDGSETQAVAAVMALPPRD